MHFLVTIHPIKPRFLIILKRSSCDVARSEARANFVTHAALTHSHSPHRAHSHCTNPLTLNRVHRTHSTLTHSNPHSVHPPQSLTHPTRSFPSSRSTDITWNFEKFLIDQEGNPVKRYSPKFANADMVADIDALLKA